MNSAFDAIQGQRAIVAAAADAHAAVKALAQKLASTLHETEALHHHAVKVEAWMRDDLKTKRTLLDELVNAAELKAKGE